MKLSLSEENKMNKNLLDALIYIQTKLKAPKSQFNKFGGYKYRNCEDILEAVKPLCAETKTYLKIADEVVEIGGRIYVKATASLYGFDDIETATAYAREEESKKGMDGSQVTGASSSYARKYALNGLFGIDDTKDSDTTNTGDNSDNNPKPIPKKTQIKSESVNSKNEDELNEAYEKALNYEVNGVSLRELWKKDTATINALLKDENTPKETLDAIHIIQQQIKIQKAKKQAQNAIDTAARI